MVVRNLHVESRAGVAQVLTGQHSALLADQQRSGIRVAADVVGADGKIGNLEALDAVDVEALVEHAVLDDGVALAWCHGTGTERVPSGLDVSWE